MAREEGDQKTFKPLHHGALILPYISSSESHLSSRLIPLVFWDMKQEKSHGSETEEVQKHCKRVAEEGVNRSITTPLTFSGNIAGTTHYHRKQLSAVEKLLWIKWLVEGNLNQWGSITAECLFNGIKVMKIQNTKFQFWIPEAQGNTGKW